MKSQRIQILHGAQVMRMQQIATGAMVAALAIGVVHYWPTSPSLAIVGSLLWLVGYSGVLGVEFMMSAIVNRSDASPKANWQELLKAWWDEAYVVAKVFFWRQPYRANAVLDQLEGAQLRGQRGVVFLHGLVCNRGFWTPWLKHLKKQGLTDSSHAFMALSLEPVFCSIDAYVDQIEQAVQLVTEASGLKPILVCHSMGGLAARAWLDRQTFDRVQHVVTIGTPHNGTWLARFAQGLSGHQMRPGSDWLRQLDERMPAVNKSTLFTCWYSNCDNVVFPTSTAMLPGADNRFVRGAGHLKLAFLPEVMSKTLAMIYLPTRPNVVET